MVDGDQAATRGTARGAERSGRAGWRLPIPTRRGATVIGLSAVIVASGAVHPVLGWIGLAASVVVATATVIDGFLAPSPHRFTATRVGRHDLGSSREEEIAVEFCDTAEREGARFSSFRAVDDLSPTFHRVSEPGPFTMATGDRARLASVVRPERRGRHRLGAFHVRAIGPLGLSERDLVFDVGAEIRVVPGLVSVAESTHVLRRGQRIERGVRRTRRRGEGSAFESLRDHVAGEDLRKVDWKASARQGRLISRQFEIERNQSLILLIDCGRWMSGTVGDDPAGPSRLDHVLDAAILLAQVAAMRDDRIGALAFAGTVLRWVPPAKGRAAVRRIVDAVFDLEPSLDESDYAAAFAHIAVHHRKRAMLVLFTDVLSKETSRIVAQELGRAVRRHVPLCVSLRDVALDACADCVPASSSAAYRQAAAEDLLLERDEALTRMRRSGIHIVDADPRHLGPPLIERYLDIKSRSAI